MVMVAAFAMVVALGFAALAIDSGQFLQTRTKLQADVDAMALGGAQLLCGTADCSAQAEDAANALRGPNALDPSEGEADLAKTCGDDPIDDHSMITARATRYNEALLAQIVGFFGTDITACATAGKYALGGSAGVVPFGIEDECLDGGMFGETYTLKYDSDTDSANEACDASGGNFAALGIDASGAGPGCNTTPGDEEELKFKRALCFGANRGICTVDADPCDGEAGDNCAGSPVEAYEICTETGNMTGPIKEGVGHRISYTSQQCDEWHEVADEDTEKLLTNCDPFDGTGPASLRVILLPIVDGLFGDGGSHKVTVVGFALFFLEDFDPSDCSGDDCDITGRFIHTQMSTGGLGYAPLEPDSSITIVRILE